MADATHPNTLPNTLTRLDLLAAALREHAELARLVDDGKAEEAI